MAGQRPVQHPDRNLIDTTKKQVEGWLTGSDPTAPVDQIGQQIAQRMTPLFEGETRGLAENDRAAVVIAVGHRFCLAFLEGATPKITDPASANPFQEGGSTGQMSLFGWSRLPGGIRQWVGRIWLRVDASRKTQRSESLAV